MFADNLGIYNVCETAACHDLHGAPEPPMLWLVALPFMRHRPTLLAFIYAWPATHSYLFSTVCRKKTPLVACKIYIFLTFAY